MPHMYSLCGYFVVDGREAIFIIAHMTHINVLFECVALLSSLNVFNSGREGVNVRVVL